jgi:hypothetical protein
VSYQPQDFLTEDFLNSSTPSNTSLLSRAISNATEQFRKRTALHWSPLCVNFTAQYRSVPAAPQVVAVPLVSRVEK